jgi:eukaryotic-like serine/threonine-protein kinase
MGVVYRARQVSLNRVVALKMILSGPFASQKGLERFRTEAQMAAGLQHPNIVAIHEVGEHEGLPFFSMDFVEGCTLAELVRKGPLPACLAATYGQKIAEAVQYAHEHQVLHRDLKPSNILIDGSDQPRITDFGLARRLDLDRQTALSGELLGTPGYMSPEQASGQHDQVRAPSDIYGLGAMLYHLLTGRPPFMGDTVAGVADRATGYRLVLNGTGTQITCELYQLTNLEAPV